MYESIVHTIAFAPIFLASRMLYSDTRSMSQVGQVIYEKVKLTDVIQ